MTGCPDDEPGDESPSSTTGGADTSTGETPSTDDTSTGDMPTTGEGETSTGTPGTDSGSSDSGSGDTGSLADCVDEDIGSAMGRAVASGSTLGAGDDFDLGPCLVDGFEPDGGGADGGKASAPSDDYVVAWTAPRAGLYIFSLAGSDYDTTLGVWPAACDGDAHQCNDDCYELESATTYDAAAGEQVFIVIDGFDGKTGDFTLSISEGTEECYVPEPTGTSGGFDSDDGGVNFIATTG